MPNPECPCGSGRRYPACCRPFHRGEEPPDAPTLMRSRFSAYALGEPEYLWRTLHPEHPDRAQPKEAFIAQVRAARQLYRYVRLRMLDQDEGPESGRARVLFHAEIYEKGRERSFLELSTFLRTAEGWRYHSGLSAPLAAASPQLRDLRIPGALSLLQ